MTKPLFTFTRKEMPAMLAKAMAELEAGTLGCCHSGTCKYMYKQTDAGDPIHGHCVIGAMVPENIATLFLSKHIGPIEDAFKRGDVEADSSGIKQDIIMLQQIHDNRNPFYDNDLVSDRKLITERVKNTLKKLQKKYAA